MQIKCSSCHNAINIPDEKLPKDKTFSVTCPSCKKKTKVDQNLYSQEKKQQEEKTIDTATIAVSTNEFLDDEDPVFYDEKDKIALVLDDQQKHLWTKALEELSYKIEYAKSPEHAAHKMKFTQFHLVALHENYGNISLDKNVAYNSLCKMSMSSRRKIFMVLVGKEFKTTNNMQAFAASANLVINQKDLEKP